MRFNDCCNSWKEKLNQAWGLATTAVRKITLNGTDYTPDGNGNVDLGTIQGGGSTSASDIKLTDGRDVQTAVDAIEDEIGDESTAGSIVYRLNSLDTGKQDKLTAGDNITIENNVISADVPVIMMLTSAITQQLSLTAETLTPITTGTLRSYYMNSELNARQTDNYYVFWNTATQYTTQDIATQVEDYGYYCYDTGITVESILNALNLNSTLANVVNGSVIGGNVILIGGNFTPVLKSSTIYDNSISGIRITKDFNGTISIEGNQTLENNRKLVIISITELTAGDAVDFTIAFRFNTVSYIKVVS